MREFIEQFFTAEKYAVIGVSADRKKFGNVVYRTMKDRGFEVFPVNPKLSEVEGDTCYGTITELPYGITSVVTVVPPAVTAALLPECMRKGVQTVWMQPGSESEDAIDLAKRQQLRVVHGECILMFLEPVKSFHAIHRWVNKLVGAYPK